MEKFSLGRLNFENVKACDIFGRNKARNFYEIKQFFDIAAMFEIFYI